MNILGISAYYHDSASCLLRNGDIAVAAEEERFSRKKHDHRFPSHTVKYIVDSFDLQPFDVDYVAFYDKPLLKFERILETHLHFAPRGFNSFLHSMPIWIKEKLFMYRQIEKELNKVFGLKKNDRVNWKSKLLFPEHHQSHAASAFFPSPFDRAAILTIDGVGEWATTSAGVGNKNQIETIYEIDFPHSIGLLYSAFTYYLGFKVNSGEYKVMGLAPYGEPKYVGVILDNLINLKKDGSFSLNMEYFDYCTDLKMTNLNFENLFGAPPRIPESRLTQKDMDLACSIQNVIEEVVLRMAKFLKRETKANNLCLSGGVALNCVANGKILKEGVYDNIWVQPAAGDSGGALGAALAVWYQYLGKDRAVDKSKDSMKGAYLGPSFTDNDIEGYLKKNNIPYSKLNDDDMCDLVSRFLAEGKVIGWFQGKMEFGPRALGNRSIIGDARNPKMQEMMNKKIKYRESFRPFAPSILREDLSDFFEMDCDSPYMLLVAPVKKERRINSQKDNRLGLELINTPRSDIPAVTHVDFSARIQTVNSKTNQKYHKLIKSFKKKTGYPLIVNTSFNIRSEPIVCTPKDAYKCFMRTEIDHLVLGNCLLNKKDQILPVADLNWKKNFEPD